MKKFVRILVLVMACLLVFTALVSCKKDKDKDKDKKVSFDKIEEKARNAGFEVEVERFAEADEDGMIASMSINDPNSLSLLDAVASAYEFKDADSAKKAYEDAKEELEKAEEAAKSLGIDFEYVVKSSGKIVIMGSSEIINKVWK